MKKVMLKTTLSLAVTLASSQIFASGFALNEQSVSGMGPVSQVVHLLPTMPAPSLVTLPVCPAFKVSK